MEQNESNLSFDQLPKAVGELLTKVDYVISRLDEKKEADGSSPTLDDDQMMTMDEACQFIGKKRSTMYSLTSERRIPYRKRGNKLYFSRRNSLSGFRAEGHTTSLIPSPSRNRQSSMHIWSRYVRRNGTSQLPSSNNDSYFRRWDMTVPLPH